MSKSHCGDPARCEKDCYSTDACDCCCVRCGPHNDSLGAPKASVAYVQRADGKILCVWNHTHLTWGLPGGKAEPGEDFATAMTRELLEETGLVAKHWADVFEAPSSSGSGRLVRAFIVDVWRADGGLDFDDARQIEDDSPIAWLNREDLLHWSKFDSYYRPMFAAIDSRAEPQEPLAPGSHPADSRGSASDSCYSAELAAIRPLLAESCSVNDELCNTHFAAAQTLLRMVDELTEAARFEAATAKIQRELYDGQKTLSAVTAAELADLKELYEARCRYTDELRAKLTEAELEAKKERAHAEMILACIEGPDGWKCRVKALEEKLAETVRERAEFGVQARAVAERLIHRVLELSETQIKLADAEKRAADQLAISMRAQERVEAAETERDEWKRRYLAERHDQ